MLRLSLLFLLQAVASGILGFMGLAGAAATLAKFFLLRLFGYLGAGHRPRSHGVPNTVGAVFF
jgi:uncharacterized membrane protein YtjA (UPF0391 family)